MAPNVGNLVLEQLRLIRGDIAQMDARITDLNTKLAEGLADVSGRLQSVEGVLFGLGGYIRSIDSRVEHIEEKLGA